MIAPAGEALKRTALNAIHRASGAKMVDYCGWDMPVEYSGITREHLAVRTAAGLFDVSHMGEIEVRGPQALALLQHVTSNDVSRLQDGQAQYSALMLPSGSAIDDCVVHRFAPDHYFLCVNAANTDKDYAWMVQCNSFGADVRNVSAQYAQIALQGPRALEILAKVTEARSGGFEVLLVPARPLRRRGRHSGAHGLHGRGRVRVLLPSRLLGASVEHFIGRGQSGRADSGGPRRAQHAAAGSRVRTLRARIGRRNHAA